MIKRVAAFAVLAGLAVPATAAHADTFYGGGGLPAAAPAPTFKAYLDSWGIGIARAANGSRVGVRVSFSVRCKRPGGTGWRSTDAVVKGALRADGTFRLRRVPVKTAEMGTVRVTALGSLATPGRADGTVSVSTRLGCGLSRRPFTTRQVDPAAPAPGAPPAPVDGLLYGITDQALAPGRVPYGVVAQVGGGGTTAHAYMSYGLRCVGTVGRRRYDNRITFQTLLTQAPIAGGAWSAGKPGVPEHGVTRDAAWQAAFDGAALRGTFHDTRRVKDRKGRETCASGTHGFVALP